MPAVRSIATKACKGCGNSFPRDSFPFKSRRTNIRQAYCQTCWPEERRRVRANQTAANQRRKVLKASGVPVDEEPRTLLHAARVALWLSREERRLCLEHYGVTAGSRMTGVPGVPKAIGRGLLASRLGTNERIISRIVDGQRYQYPHANQQLVVTLDMLDRWTCNAGTPWVLGEQFPELYSFDDDLEMAA